MKIKRIVATITQTVTNSDNDKNMTVMIIKDIVIFFL